MIKVEAEKGKLYFIGEVFQVVKDKAVKELKEFYQGWQLLSTDNFVFTLCFPVTPFVLLVLTAFLVGLEIFSSPMRCSDNSDRAKYTEALCRASTLYLLPDENGGIGDEEANITIASSAPFFLVGISVLMYVPRFICGLPGHNTIYDVQFSIFGDEHGKKNSSYLADRLSSIVGRSLQVTYWCICLIVCELLNLIIIVALVVVLNYQLGHGFVGLGPAALDPTQRFEVLNKVFPKAVNCTIEGKFFTCILDINSGYEKLFTIVWLWLLLLGVLTVISLVFRLFIIICLKVKRNVWAPLLLLSTDSSDKNMLEKLLPKMRVEDWFFLFYLSRQLNSTVFKQVIRTLTKKKNL